MKKKLFLLIVCLGMITACVGGRSPVSSFYMLHADSSVSKPDLLFTTTVGVDTVSLPDYLDRPQIVTFKADMVELNIDEFNRWGDSLDTMLQQVIVDDLSAQFPNATIDLLTSGEYGTTPLTVKITINRLGGILNQTVLLDASWQIVDQDDRVLIQKRSRLTGSTSEGYSGYVKSQSRLLSDLSLEIAQYLARLKVK